MFDCVNLISAPHPPLNEAKKETVHLWEQRTGRVPCLPCFCRGPVGSALCRNLAWAFTWLQAGLRGQGHASHWSGEEEN